MKAGLAVVKVGLQRPPREDREVLRVLQGLVTSYKDQRFGIFGDLNVYRAAVCPDLELSKNLFHSMALHAGADGVQLMFHRKFQVFLKPRDAGGDQSFKTLTKP